MRNELAMRLFSRRPLTPHAAKDQIAALSNLCKGLMRPEKCSQFEPIRNPFNHSDIGEPIRWLSAPAGSFMYRKGRPTVVTGVMWNLSSPDLSERDNTGKPIRRLYPPFPPPAFVNYWTADFDGTWANRVGIEIIASFASAAFDVSGADFGLLTTLADLNAKNYLMIQEGPVQSMSYKGLDPARGVPGLYWTNFFSREFAKWLGLGGLLEDLATMKSLAGGGTLLQFGESASDCGTPETLVGQRLAIEALGPQKFFDIRFPDRNLDAPNWGRAVPPNGPPTDEQKI